MRSSGSNSAVECDLAKVEVAGSIPVSRSSFLEPRTGEGFSFLRAFCVLITCAACVNEHPARSPSGKAEVCKTSIVSSILTRASKILPSALSHQP
jgi:hypothetical protein